MALKVFCVDVVGVGIGATRLVLVVNVLKVSACDSAASFVEALTRQRGIANISGTNISRCCSYGQSCCCFLVVCKTLEKT